MDVVILVEEYIRLTIFFFENEPVVTILLSSLLSVFEFTTGNHPCQRYTQCSASTRNKAEKNILCVILKRVFKDVKNGPKSLLIADKL